MFKNPQRQTATLRVPSFGRRGVHEEANDVAPDDIWRGVASLHKLSLEARADRDVRAACLFYALRHFHAADAIDFVVQQVDQRIQAFERLMAEVPDLLGDESIDATLEDAVYATIALTPLTMIGDTPRFDERQFLARLPKSLDREINARARAGRLRIEERDKLYLSTVH